MQGTKLLVRYGIYHARRFTNLTVAHDLLLGTLMVVVTSLCQLLAFHLSQTCPIHTYQRHCIYFTVTLHRVLMAFSVFCEALNYTNPHCYWSTLTSEQHCYVINNSV